MFIYCRRNLGNQWLEIVYSWQISIFVPTRNKLILTIFRKIDKFPSTTDWPGKSRLTSPVSFGILSEEAKVSAPKQPTMFRLLAASAPAGSGGCRSRSGSTGWSDSNRINPPHCVQLLIDISIELERAPSSRASSLRGDLPWARALFEHRKHLI